MTTNSAELKLLNCPFCGGEPILNHIEPHSHKLMFNGHPIMNDYPGSWTIECCDIGMIKDTREEAIAAWNRRTAAQGEQNKEIGTWPLGTPHTCGLSGEHFGVCPECVRQAGSAEQVSEQSAYFAHQYLRFQEYAKAAGFDSLTSAIAFACQHRYALSAPERKPFAYFQWNSGWGIWEQVIDSASGREGVVAAYMHPAPERKVKDAELPPLPTPEHDMWTKPGFTANQMREYAIAALNQQGEQTAPA